MRNIILFLILGSTGAFAGNHVKYISHDTCEISPVLESLEIKSILIEKGYVPAEKNDGNFIQYSRETAFTQGGTFLGLGLRDGYVSVSLKIGSEQLNFKKNILLSNENRKNSEFHRKLKRIIQSLPECVRN